MTRRMIEQLEMLPPLRISVMDDDAEGQMVIQDTTDSGTEERDGFGYCFDSSENESASPVESSNWEDQESSTIGSKSTTRRFK